MALVHRSWARIPARHLPSITQPTSTGSTQICRFSSSPIGRFSTSLFGQLEQWGNHLVAETTLLVRNTVHHISKNRHGNSLITLYNRLYEKEKLMELMRLLPKRRKIKSSNRLLLGSAFVSFYNWGENVLKNEDMKIHCREIQICNKLTQDTLTCKSCGLRLKIEKCVENVTYCQCKDAPSSVYGLKESETNWSPFLERKDIIVWRKDHPTMKGMYIYKMYGRFDDVTAREFLAVQLDMSEFRLKWDSSTAQCFVLDRNKDSDQEIYYWEVNWPRFFSNRDYCCLRQTHTDPDTGITVLISRSTEHPSCPEKSKCMRVQDYDSVLAVKPFGDPDQPGIEFSLTGFENPGVQLPESIITWVAIRGMPEYMNNLRSACKMLRSYESSLKQRLGATSPSLSSSSSSASSCSIEALQDDYDKKRQKLNSSIYA